ncbi:MAG: tetratricopeptide repeat protein [Bacteroidota bacterium]
MKLRLVLALLYCGMTFAGFAQKDDEAEEPDYTKLWNLFIDEKYEQLLMKSEAITQNDKRRKEPMPYMFMSMACYEMSKNEEFDEDYPKAFKDAMKNAAKYRKKDKSYKYESEFEEHLMNLRSDAMEVGENFIEEEKYSKAKTYYKYLTQMDPNCQASWLMYGFCLAKMNDIGGAKEAMKRVSFRSESDFDELSNEQVIMAKYALISYSEHLYQTGMRDSAQVTIDLGKEFYMDDKEYQLVHEDMHR